MGLAGVRAGLGVEIPEQSWHARGAAWAPGFLQGSVYKILNGWSWSLRTAGRLVEPKIE